MQVAYSPDYTPAQERTGRKRHIVRESAALAVLLGAALLTAPSAAMAAPAKKRAASAAPARPAPVTPAPKPPPHQIAPTGVLGAADLIAIARLKQETPGDVFSEDPTKSYIGRAFVLTLDPGELTTEYDKEHQILSVYLPDSTDYIDLDKDVAARSFVGQNAYGTKSDVLEMRGNAYGIQLPPARRRSPISVEAKLAPELARALSAALRLRVTGTIIAAKGLFAAADSAIFEQSIYTSATLDSPVKKAIKGYYLAVSLSKAEWIDTRTGKIAFTDVL